MSSYHEYVKGIGNVSIEINGDGVAPRTGRGVAPVGTSLAGPYNVVCAYRSACLCVA